MEKKVNSIKMDVRCTPVLDPAYIPFAKYYEAFLKTAEKPFAISIEREDDQVQVFETKIHGTDERFEEDFIFVERLAKFLIWARGGFRLTLSGDDRIAARIAATYASAGKRAFDFNFMANVYEKPFEVVATAYADRPKPYQKSVSIGRHLDGCRIGFDAGGSDRKVSAVIDGEPVFSEEVVWLPKVTSDPQYHYDGILDSLRRAAAHLPRVDAIGVSSAGIYINNETKAASLFLAVGKEDFEKTAKKIYIDTAKEIGADIPLVVANDGDVTALAGAMSLKSNSVLGIAMGTSEAVGFVDADGNITGWLNELAFAPVDLAEDAMADEWSGDIGCGVKYFSQDGVIKLAPAAGIDLSAAETPAEKLKIVQGLMAKGDANAAKIYETIGAYLGYALKLYSIFYDLKEVLLLGRVVSGKGGDIVLETAKEVLAVEYPELKINLSLPSEKTRRVGQSVAAASLPALRGSGS